MMDSAAPVDDGTTGGSARSGRRTNIIQVLRDSKTALSVVQVAGIVGIHPNTARFHLESLVEAGLASRESEVTNRRGRRQVLYTGTLPNQTHERAQGYRLLSQILTGVILAKSQNASTDLYEAGLEWGVYLTSRPVPFETLGEDEIAQRVMDKLDALWFAPELVPTPRSHLVLHNCPFSDTASRYPGLVCWLHGGMINGSLRELRSSQRVVELQPSLVDHRCVAWMGRAEELGDDPVRVALATPDPDAGAGVAEAV